MEAKEVNGVEESADEEAPEDPGQDAAPEPENEEALREKDNEYIQTLMQEVAISEVWSVWEGEVAYLFDSLVECA